MCGDEDAACFRLGTSCFSVPYCDWNSATERPSALPRHPKTNLWWKFLLRRGNQWPNHNFFFAPKAKKSNCRRHCGCMDDWSGWVVASSPLYFLNRLLCFSARFVSRNRSNCMTLELREAFYVLELRWEEEEWARTSRRSLNRSEREGTIWIGSNDSKTKPKGGGSDVGAREKDSREFPAGTSLEYFDRITHVFNLLCWEVLGVGNQFPELMCFGCIILFCVMVWYQNESVRRRKNLVEKTFVRCLPTYLVCR